MHFACSCKLLTCPISCEEVIQAKFAVEPVYIRILQAHMHAIDVPVSPLCIDFVYAWSFQISRKKGYF